MKEFLQPFVGKKITLTGGASLRGDVTLHDAKDSCFVVTASDQLHVYPYIRIVSIVVDNQTDTPAIALESLNQSLKMIADGLYDIPKFGGSQEGKKVLQQIADALSKK